MSINLSDFGGSVVLPIKEIGVKAPEYFEGREDELSAIKKAFENGKQMVVLTGIGGVGKSELATKFISECGYRCPQNVTLKDDDEVTWNNLLNKFSYSESVFDKFLKLRDFNLDEAYSTLKEALANLDGNIILFIDNANKLNEDMLEELLCDLNCKILLTTRNAIKVPENAVMLEVNEMPSETASKIFVREYGEYKQGEENLFKSAVYDYMFGNTRAIVMISKMLKTQGLSLNSYSLKREDAIKNNKFHSKLGGENRFDTIANNLCTSLKVAEISLTNIQKNIIAIMLLVEQLGIPEEAIIKKLNLQTANDFIVLADYGFINRTLTEYGYELTMHPLISKMFELSGVKPDDDTVIFVCGFYYNYFTSNHNANDKPVAYLRFNSKVGKHFLGTSFESVIKEASKEMYYTLDSDDLDLCDILFDKDNIQELTLKDKLGFKMRFEQAAIIPYDDEIYCMLKPLDEIPGVAQDEAMIFKLDTDDEGFSVLTICADEDICKEVYEQYLQLLREAGII